MPKNTRRVTVTRTVTFTATVDTAGYPEESDSAMLTLLGGAAGNTGTLAIGELLAGSNLTNNGVINRANWSVTGTSVNIEPYITRPRNTALPIGQRVTSISPASGNEAALGKLFVVTAINTGTNGGRTADSASEPTWNLTNGNTTTDGGITYRTIDKFPSIVNFTGSTAYSLGTIVRPSTNSPLEFLVTTAGTSASSAPTWSNGDNVGSTLTSNTVTFTCIAGNVTYAFQTQYALGDIVKPIAATNDQYIVTTAGRSDTTALSASVGASVTRGTAVFKRLV